MGGNVAGGSGGNYYEDVDPRFAGDSSSAATPRPPGGLPPHMQLQSKSSYEDMNSGSRSPADSERSTFTSISQRGVNPRWRPGADQAPPPMPAYGGPQQGPIGRRPVGQPRPDVLDSNPDFQITGSASGGLPRHGSPRVGGPGGGMVPQSSYPGGL